MVQHVRESQDAVRRAREVVGLYGDPRTTWGICLELEMEDELDLEAVGRRLAVFFSRHPHLGSTPQVTRAHEDWSAARDLQGAGEFGADGELVRVMVSKDGRRIFICAHHGAVDGLGLLAIGESVTGTGLQFQARGIGDRAARTAFLRSSVVRLFEALFTPPARFRGTADPQVPGELLCRQAVAPLPAGAAATTWAAAQAFGRWPRRRGRPGGGFLVALGVSRREPGAATPDRCTAYLRLRVTPGSDLEAVRRTLAATKPEPDFPETSAGGVAPLVTRLLRNRLGATTTISNLGVITGPGLVSCTMWPALNGPSAVGIGVATTPQGTTVSLRVRRAEFSEPEAHQLLTLVVDALQETYTAPTQ